MELFYIIALAIIVVFLPVWLFLDWMIKRYDFSNKILNTIIILNAIFSSPINIAIATEVLINSLWEYEFFIGSRFGGSYYTLPIDTPARIISFLAALVLLAAVKFFIWNRANKMSLTYESILKYSKRYFFQLPFLFPLYILFVSDKDFDEVVLFIFFICAIFAVGLYMYLSGKYIYKPIWFKDKTTKEM
jgi:hypothetical protein